jgi:hypothetical protein
MGAAGKSYCHSFSLKAMIEQLNHLYGELFLTSHKTVEPKVDADTLKPEKWIKNSEPADEVTHPLPDQTFPSRSSDKQKESNPN